MLVQQYRNKIKHAKELAIKTKKLHEEQIKKTSEAQRKRMESKELETVMLIQRHINRLEKHHKAQLFKSINETERRH